MNLDTWQLAEELQKPIFTKIEKQKACSFFKDNIWGADLADMLLITKFNKDFVFCYTLVTFIVNMHGLRLKKRDLLQFLMLLRNIFITLNANQIKDG